MVDLFNFNEINDGHGNVDIDGDVDVVHFVKGERCNLLVVVLLLVKEEDQRNVGLHLDG